MRVLLSFAAVALVLAGCATDPLRAYPEAQTVRECEVLSQADDRQIRQAQAVQPSSGNLLADIIASGVGAGVREGTVERRLAGCIARVSGQGSPVAVDEPIEEFVIADPGGSQLTPAPMGSDLPRRTVVPPASSCPAGASVLYGGTQYCVGR